MPLSMYEASVPVFIQSLHSLSAILAKAANYAETRKIDPSVLINARLAPDMLPLSRQIQITSDMVKGGAARLAGIEVPRYEDTETTFPELQARITKTVNFLQTVTAKMMDGSEKRHISLKIGGRDRSFEGQGYLLDFVIPNFYFHLTVAYAILRHNGLDIGKADFLGSTQPAH